MFLISLFIKLRFSFILVLRICSILTEHHIRMVMELSLRPDSVTNLESFLATSRYKQLAESTMSFNRRLNEERKMRIPYIDGQTGVAQKHYPDQQRSARERMPGVTRGQVYSYPQVTPGQCHPPHTQCYYPQRLWRKRRYQYLQYFMLPKHLRYEPEPEFNTGMVGVSVELVTGASEDSNGSNNNCSEKVLSLYQIIINNSVSPTG